MKVSVIIPVFNNQAYIRQCLDSVLRQSLKEIQLICIDDGSTDGSYSILLDYAERYSNLVILHQENRGQGNARNSGIQKATGEFVAFMDGDDFYYDEYALEKLYTNAVRNNVDICGGSACNFRDGIFSTEGMCKGLSFDKEGIMFYKDYQMCYGFWRFIYKRSFLVNNKIMFPEYRRCQDIPFFVKAMIEAKKFYAIKDTCYCYRKGHKKVNFSQTKIVDYAKGIRDALVLSKDAELPFLHTEIINEMHNGLSTMIYIENEKGCKELESISDQINKNIDKTLIVRKLLLCSNEYLMNLQNSKKFVEQIGERENAFIRKLQENKNIYVYGAGDIGKRVISFLKSKQINICSVLVTTKKKNPDYVLGVRVFAVDEIEVNNEDIVLIATYPHLHQEIEAILRKRNVENIEPIYLEEFLMYEMHEKEIGH